MRHWNGKDYVENDKVDSFLSELDSLCQKYDMTILHEDTEGSFILNNGYCKNKVNWIMSAEVSGFN